MIELDLQFFLFVLKSVKYASFWFLVRNYENIKGRFAFEIQGLIQVLVRIHFHTRPYNSEIKTLSKTT